MYIQTMVVRASYQWLSMFLLVECPDQELLQHLARTGRAASARPILTISALTETPGSELRYFWISDKIPVLNWRTSSSSSSLNKAEKKCFLEREYLMFLLSKVFLLLVFSSTLLTSTCKFTCLTYGTFP